MVKVENLRYAGQDIKAGEDILSYGGLRKFADDIGGYINTVGEG